MVIGLVQLCQESNGFNPMPTGLAAFEAFGLATGDAVLRDHAAGNEMAGFMDGLAGAEPVGILHAEAWPGGRLERGVFEALRERLRRALVDAGPLDGLLVSLHGALLAEGEDGADAAFLETIRSVTGRALPVVATVDLHALVTSRLLAAADAVVAYHTSPHLDRRETGRRAASVLGRLLAGAKPATALVRLPMITQTEAHDTFGPVLKPLFSRLAELEATPGMLSAAVLMTQPWLDVPGLGWSVLVTADGNEDLARRTADALADEAWALRERLRCEYLDAAGAVAAAARCPKGPVIIADGADATNSGACGDSTHLLRELLGAPFTALLFVVDPEAVAAARAAGVGATVTLPVGGKRDHVFSKPVTVTGRVRKLAPVEFVLSGHLADHLAIRMGMGAVIEAGKVTLLLVERTGPGSTPKLYRCMGLEPLDYHAVVVKSPAGFRAEYGPFAAAILLASCPGCAAPDFAALPFQRIDRPLWPLDPVEDWRAVEWAKTETEGHGGRRSPAAG